MIILDIVILVPVLFGAYLGFRKGLIIEVATLLAFILGIYAGIKCSKLIAEWFAVAGDFTPEYLPVIAFSVCFLAVVVLVFFLGRWLERFVKLALLKPIDKILGGVFGLVKMIFVMAVLVVILDAYSQRTPVISEETKRESLLYKPLNDLVMTTLPVIDSSGIILTTIQLQQLQDTLLQEEN